MITAAIIGLVALGLFEIWVYRQHEYEEDFWIIGCCFFSAVVLLAIKLSGAW